MKFKDFLKENANETLIEPLKRKYASIAIKLHGSDMGHSFVWSEDDHQNAKLKPYPHGKHQVYDVDTGEVFQTLDGLFGEDGKLNPDYEHVWSFYVTVKAGAKVSIDEDFPGFVKAHDVQINSADRGRVVIDGFDKWPKADFLTIHGCEIESLAGIEKLELEEFDLHLITHDDLKCGLLRLLKCPHLMRAYVVALIGTDTEDDDLAKAVSIIDEHLPTKDIAEAMDEMMEAGLKRYAKM
jgi:hypothetical protein